MDLETVKKLVTLIQSARLDLSDEKLAQAGMESVLIAAGIPYEREVRLSRADIVDFLIAGVALEFKLRSSTKKAIYKQLCRYAKHDRVTSLLLATSTSMGLPPQIEGKDAYLVKLAEAWL